MDLGLSRLFGRAADRPPAAEAASAEDVERYTREWMAKHDVVDEGPERADPTLSLPFTDKQFDESIEQRTEFPWLYEPEKGVRWDFNPVRLRNLAQENTWVGMLVQSITKEVAETPFTIAKLDDPTEQRKRLDTHPDERTTISKELPDATAERIYQLLRDPNPDYGWHDWVEQTLGDLLEVGSATTVKAFPRAAYTGEGSDASLTASPENIRPRALQVSAPEVWTKDYEGRTGLLGGFWQFDKERAPGSGDAAGGMSGTHGFRSPIHFDTSEVMWTDMTPRSNRRYGMPPTLLVEDFLQSLDLAVTQEQQYLSRGSIPSGAWIFENWDRQEVKEWKQENEENIKGKPHKSLMFAGRGGDVRFEAMSMNFSDLEFTERMKWYARVVASAFQVPTAVVGIEPEKVNYNTFQGERENFEENTLGPYLQKLERFINSQLIHPHWPNEYHFEFKPGISESTRRMLSERVRAEFNSGLRTRNEARHELGMDDVDEDLDGFADEVTSGAADADGEGGDALDELGLSKAVYDVGGETLEISPPQYMVDAAQAADEAQADGLIPDSCGTGVGDRRKRQVLNDTVGPDVVDAMATYLTSHEEDVTADGHPETWGDDAWGSCGNAQYAKWAGVGDGRAKEWAQRKSDQVAELRGEEPTYKQYTDDGDSGNASEAARAQKADDDEALRNTDDWYQFDVQPAAVDELQADIADDLEALFDAVLSNDEIQRVIERLAADDKPTEKSLSELGRQLRDIIRQTRLVGDVADAIRSHSTDAIEATLRETIAEADADETDRIDVEAIVERLSERDVGFADRLADRLSDEIRETVGDGWAEGKNSREIAQDIAEQANIAEGWGGAERIARQELQIATGEARSAVAADLDKVEVWNDSGDNRVRDAHQAMDGKWKYAADEWVVDYSEENRGVEKETVPGDSEPGIGCRCTTLLRDRDEVDRDDYAGDATP